jgi:hypothetical protein
LNSDLAGKSKLNIELLFFTVTSVFAKVKPKITVENERTNKPFEVCFAQNKQKVVTSEQMLVHLLSRYETITLCFCFYSLNI